MQMTSDYPDIFLSYSREDQAVARRFAEALQREGFKVWWDQALHPGEAFDEVTEKALEQAKAVIVLWSKASAASRWVRSEATQAHANGRLVPVMIEACKRPIMFELTHTVDLSGWSGNAADPAWQSFLGGVRRLAGTGMPASPAPVARTEAPKFRAWRGPTLGAIALLVVAGGILLWRSQAVREPKAAPEVAAAPAQRMGQVTLAVLPFANLSADPGQEYFSDGLTEEILNQLAQVKELRVTGRTSSFAFKGKNEDLRNIARTLGVDNLLEGSVRREGGMLRITAQLIDGRDGAHLWSKTYDREASKVLALQEEVAQDVARALSVTLDVGEMSRSRGGTNDVVAYELYLRSWLNRGRQLPEREAVQGLREAVARDPGFQLAWLRLYQLLQPLASQEPGSAAELRAERARIRERLAAQLPPEGTLATEFNAMEAWEARRWLETLSGFGELMDRTPNEYLFVQALMLSSVGRFTDALALRRKSAQIDPLNAELSWQLAQSLRLAGRSAEAEAEFARSQALRSDPAVRRGYELDWRLTEPAGAAGRRIDPELLRQSTVWPYLRIDRSTIRFEDPGAVSAALRTALADPANQSEGPLGRIAEMANVLGDAQLAIDALRRSYVDLRSGWVAAIWQASTHPGIRAQPAFKDLVRDLGLVDYWRSTGNWGDFCRPVDEEDFECR